METARKVNKHSPNNYGYNGEYLLQIRDIQNLQNDKPIDLTNDGPSGSRHYQQPQRERPWNVQDEEIRPPPSSNNNIFDNLTEVMKSAKLLFSKKTRTLYHWMYPNAPKLQLKAAVAIAWETMGVQEKQFYVSQVLGKFGYLQSSLMVNPQLGCLANPPQHHVNVEQSELSHLETRSAVSNLLQDGNSWSQQTFPQASSKKRGRPRGSKQVDKQHQLNNKRMRKHPKYNVVEDFTDDPELRIELEQFQWALHMVEK